MKALKPCLRCAGLALKDQIRVETVMPIPAANPPLSREDNTPCCIDCAAADALVAWMFREPEKAQPVWKQVQWKRLKRAPLAHDLSINFLMARIAVGNDRQEQLRLPGVPMGLVYYGLVKPSAPGDLERHYDWLRTVKLIEGADES